MFLSFFRFIASIFLLTFFLPIFAYDQQGFTEYTDNSFRCEKQCIVLFGAKGESDALLFSGAFSGTGTIGYGFISGEKIIPGEFFQVAGASSEKYIFSFRNLPYYSQLPRDIPLVIFVQGEIQGKHVSFERQKNSFSDIFGIAWDDFWKIETLTPYSINLRYGVKILGISIISIGYYLFLILFIISLFIRRFRTLNSLILFGIILFLFISTRNIYTYFQIVDKGIQEFSYPHEQDKVFFDLGDYITFTQRVRDSFLKENIIQNKDCTVYVDSFRDWPYKAHWQSVYLKPCTVTENKDKAHFLIFYKKQPRSVDKATLLLEFHGSYLFKK